MKPSMSERPPWVDEREWDWVIEGENEHMNFERTGGVPVLFCKRALLHCPDMANAVYHWRRTWDHYAEKPFAETMLHHYKSCQTCLVGAAFERLSQ
jgi:hypothetical protein